MNRKNTPLLRLFGNRFASFWVSLAAGQRIPDSQCGFRLYPAELFHQIRPATDDGFAFESEVLIEAVHMGYQVVSAPIPAIYPPGARASHFRLAYDTWQITWMISSEIIRQALRRNYFHGVFTRFWRHSPRVPSVRDQPSLAPQPLIDENKSRLHPARGNT